MLQLCRLLVPTNFNEYTFSRYKMVWRCLSANKQNNDEEESEISTYGQNKGTTSVIFPNKTKMTGEQYSQCPQIGQKIKNHNLNKVSKQIQNY